MRSGQRVGYKMGKKCDTRQSVEEAVCMQISSPQSVTLKKESMNNIIWDLVSKVTKVSHVCLTVSFTNI